MHLIFFLLLIFISNLSFARAQTHLENYLDSLRETYVIPAISAAIFQHGKMLEHAVSGIRKVGSPELITKEDKFHLGSCTKSMTATLAATFVDDGVLKWKSKIAEFFPDLEIHPDLKDATFEMLLSHTSGLDINPILEGEGSREELAETYLIISPRFEVGSFHYSNIGYILAGYILEKVSGKSWETLLKERIFNPLKMKTCGFGPVSNPTEEIPSGPWGHILSDWKIIPLHADNAPIFGPSGTVHCSIPDWMKYLDIHLRGFNVESNFLSKENFMKLHEISSHDYTFGGWLRLEREWSYGSVLTHSGSNTLNYAQVWIAPKISTILISTANRGGSSGETATTEAIAEMIEIYLSNSNQLE
jgi:CubicO group peptidase (beta-lactamase class C family)